MGHQQAPGQRPTDAATASMCSSFLPAWPSPSGTSSSCRTPVLIKDLQEFTPALTKAMQEFTLASILFNTPHGNDMCPRAPQQEVTKVLES